LAAANVSEVREDKKSFLGVPVVVWSGSSLIVETLLLVLVTPPFMATFVAATVSKSNHNASDSYGVTPFIAMRPMTSSSLVAAKLKVTMWSTITAWLLVLVAIPIALRLSGTAPTVIDWERRLIEVVGTPRAIAIVLLGLAACVKNEGIALLVSVALALLFAQRRNVRRLWPAVAIAAPWLLLRATLPQSAAALSRRDSATDGG